MGTKGKTRHGWAGQGRPLHPVVGKRRARPGRDLAFGTKKEKQMGRKWDGIVRGES